MHKAARLQRAAPYAAIVSIWAILVAFANPIGDFPITDDWAYAGTVRELLATGRLRFSDWAAMNLISHIGWGALFGALFGPSHTVLRFSTLVLALGAACAVFRLCRLAGASRAVGLLGTAVSVLNPIFFFVSFSYMTDVTYAAMQLIAIVMVFGRRRLVRVVGWAVAVASLLCRQTGLAIPAAWGGAIVRRRLSIRNLALAGLALSGFVLVQTAYQYWLSVAGLMPTNYGLQIRTSVAHIATHPLATLTEASRRGLMAVFYTGLFALPLGVCFGVSALGGLNAQRRTLAVLGFLCLTLLLWRIMVDRHWMFGEIGGTIGLGWGIGTEENGVPLTSRFAQLLTLPMAGGTILLAPIGLYAAIAVYRAPEDRVTGLLVLLAAVLFVAPLFGEFYFDRYLIPLIPCVAVVLAAAFRGLKPGAPAIAVGAACAVVMTFFSVAITHDFLAWKRAQDAAYAHALRLAPADRVDAGWVLNGARFYNRFKGENLADLPGTWRLGQDYRVYSTPRRGYETIACYPVRRWLAQGNVVLLQRSLATPPE
jgi:hypothetical protein